MCLNLIYIKCKWIYSNYIRDYEIFKNDPLENDATIKQEIDRYDKARIIKKIVSIQKEKGVLNLKNLKNINELILKDTETNLMKFSLEKKTYKDTFDTYSVTNKTDKRVFITDGKLFMKI